MRQGDFDILFDGPQFASWRMTQINHVPLVRIQGDLRFVIITNQNAGIQNIQDLATKKICALASPNLATLSILSEFTNPVRQPMLVEGKGGMKGIYQRFKDGDCMAVVLRDSFYNNKISDLERDEYRVIWESMRMPNQTITMTQVIPKESRNKVVNAFTSDQGAVSALPLFKRFSKKSTRFIVAKPDEYEGLNYLLEGVVWGW
jgi:ABC-type phosphate/phosphonate transport system substrate-binding protein